MQGEEKYFTLPRLVNYDKIFANTHNAILINKLVEGKDVNTMISYLCEQHIGDSPMYATCGCETPLHGNYNIGNICPLCHHEVVMPLSDAIKNEVWLEIPSQIGYVLHPIVFKMIRKWMKNDSNRVNILESIMNPRIKMAPEIAELIPNQGFKYFKDNFWFVMDTIARRQPKKARKDTDILFDFLKLNADRIWASKLPILSKALQPITEKSSSTRLVDENVNNILDVIINIGDILLTDELMAFTEKHVEREFFAVYSEYVAYTFALLKEKLNPKKGNLRKHIYGTRLHLTFRSVIVPITTPHYGDELHLPWKIGLTLFQYHILAVLVNRYNYSVSDAYNKLWTGMNKYDFDLDKIMQLLIEECPYKGIPTVFNRNPTIRLKSLPMLFITKVKPSLKTAPASSLGEEDSSRCADTGIYVKEAEVDAVDLRLARLMTDETIALSPLIVPGPNADFDGDEMNGVPIFEMDEVPKFMNLHPREWTISTDDMRVGNAGLAIPNQLFCLLNGWMADS